MRTLVHALLCSAWSSGVLLAQNVTPLDLRTEYLTNMKEVEEKVVALAEAFPADKYAWRPGAGVRSVSEVLMHIASEHYGYMPTAPSLPPISTWGPVGSSSATSKR